MGSEVLEGLRDIPEQVAYAVGEKFAETAMKGALDVNKEQIVAAFHGSLQDLVLNVDQSYVEQGFKNVCGNCDEILQAIHDMDLQDNLQVIRDMMQTADMRRSAKGTSVVSSEEEERPRRRISFEDEVSNISVEDVGQ